MTSPMGVFTRMMPGHPSPAFTTSTSGPASCANRISLSRRLTGHSPSGAPAVYRSRRAEFSWYPPGVEASILPVRHALSVRARVRWTDDRGWARVGQVVVMVVREGVVRAVRVLEDGEAAPVDVPAEQVEVLDPG